MNVPALHKYFIDSARQPFVFGKNDCVTFVVEVLRIGWSKDYREHMQYDSRATAVRRLRQLGGLRAAAAKTFGAELEPCEFQPGCVAYLEMPRGALGVVMDGYIAVRGNNCIHRVANDSAFVGWMVP